MTRTITTTCALGFAAVLLSAVAAPALAQRQRYSMDPGWWFTNADSLTDLPPGWAAPWRRVDLPHDWSIEGTPTGDAPGGGRVGYFPTGIGWYRKAFRMPPGSRGRAALLEFDGVYMNSDVWINGFHLGNRPYGYSSFAYDVTRHLAPGVNEVVVRVDNSRQPNSRWYTGSGIYRHTWLTLSDPLHVGHWGVWVTTPRADSALAEVAVRTRIANDGAAARLAVLRTIVLDADGREVARAESAFALGRGDSVELAQRMPVAAPHLWSVEDPYLYTLRTEIAEGARTLDTVATPFGIRSIAFDADRGFLLNGQRVKLLGVNLHHDAGAFGAAVPERVWERRLERLKVMGANAIRTSHNPPAPEFLDLCDRMGFLVMAEAFDEWTIGKVDQGYHRYFDQWAERDVADFVHRDRNHPSIVLWSAGNEIGEQSTPDGVDVLRRLLAVFHREDPTRLVTTGNDNIAADGHPATLAFLDAEDVVGYNYVDRWHERRELFAEQDRHDHPNWKMIGTETGNVLRGFAFGPPRPADSSRALPNYLSGMIEPERLWKWVMLHDYFAGDFMWTGIDYLGEAFWPLKGAASGALDITGRPKDAFYLYQSLWTSRPVLHLFPHWPWPGKEGQTIPVVAYTNCNRVELFLNGRSLGEKRLEFPAQGTSGGWNTYASPVVNATTNDLHLEWDVPYEPGVLTAVGRTREGRVACRDSIRTAGAPARLEALADRDTITDAPGDLAQIELAVVDSAGTVVPSAANLVSVTVSGGTLIAMDNADMRDLSPYRSGQRRVFDGYGIAYVRADRPGRVSVTVRAEGLAEAAVSLVVQPGPRVNAILPVPR